MLFMVTSLALSLAQLWELSRFPLLLLSAPACILWLVRALAETNRTPFDFAEGERELVSGFNIEYGAGGFALIFMAEYSRILLLRALTTLLVGAGGPLRAFSLPVLLGTGFFWA
jgi:NADH-ubiquinone oxidoreductase chain 1